MNFFNILAIAFKAITGNKRRSFLTMLGVIIGVGSVVLLTSIGTGLQASVNDQFSALGSNTLFVVPGNPFGSGGGFSNAQDQIVERSKPTLKITQLNEILRNNRDVISAGTATALGAAEAKYGTVTKKITIYGVTESFPAVQKSTTEKGEWFSAPDNAASKRVALLGPKIATELFGEVDPLNKKIKLDGQTYTIVGILKPQGGGLGGPTFDNYVYLPLNTLFDNFNTQVVNSFVFKSRDQSVIPEAKKGVDNLSVKVIKKSIK
jgi:putative ABC transport system permease protein